MTYDLVVTEKPSSARKIAQALSDGTPVKEKKNGVEYFKVTFGKKDIVVACAVGHLFSVAEREKKRTYPSYDLIWKPTYEVEKGSAHAKKYATLIASLAKKAKDVTIACDYDIEGEVIGLNVVRELCKREDARRMKFSTLTTKELRESYRDASPTLDWGQAKAGETRHFLDWMYGVNLSRALTQAVKSAGRYHTMSVGRVQGPALRILVDREREIKAFISEPFWQVVLRVDAKGAQLEALHEADVFKVRADAESAQQAAAGVPKARVASIATSRFEKEPPYPFDLTSLQTEAYKVFGINPREALAIAQGLYLKGLISYPRTSSQQLPASIAVREILAALGKIGAYADMVNGLLKKGSLVPNNGKKTDPAHPAIHPTGEHPKGLGERDAKIYDLIVRRTLASFGDPAVRETMTATFDAGGERFSVKGTRTVKQGWHEFYGPHLRLEEVQLPTLMENDRVDVLAVDILDKETQPPKRFSPASIIKRMEKVNVGTKSTRAAVVDTLADRGYIEGQSIVATELGLQMVDVLSQYSPRIIDVELTRHFEDELEEIRSGGKTEEQVLTEAREVLTGILDEFRKKEKSIGDGLRKSKDLMMDLARTIGPCPVCDKGTLVIKRSRFGLFVACDSYPACSATFNIPKNALVKPTKLVCDACRHPIVKVIRARRRPEEICLNPLCPKKESARGEPGACPKCGKELVLRKSVYGAFYGCSGYPSCRYAAGGQRSRASGKDVEGEA